MADSDSVTSKFQKHNMTNLIKLRTFLTILDAILDLQSWILKIWRQIRIKRTQKHNNVRFHWTFLLFFESLSSILNFENLMEDLNSATPKTWVRPISSSSEHFSKSWSPYWICHFEFRKPKVFCQTTWFFAPMFTESVKFSHDFNVKKNDDKHFST